MKRARNDTFQANLVKSIETIFFVSSYVAVVGYLINRGIVRKF